MLEHISTKPIQLEEAPIAFAHIRHQKPLFYKLFQLMGNKPFMTSDKVIVGKSFFLDCSSPNSSPIFEKSPRENSNFIKGLILCIDQGAYHAPMAGRPMSI